MERDWISSDHSWTNCTKKNPRQTKKARRKHKIHKCQFRIPTRSRYFVSLAVQSTQTHERYNGKREAERKRMRCTTLRLGWQELNQFPISSVEQTTTSEQHYKGCAFATFSLVAQSTPRWSLPVREPCRYPTRKLSDEMDRHPKWLSLQLGSVTRCNQVGILRRHSPR